MIASEFAILHVTLAAIVETELGFPAPAPDSIMQLLAPQSANLPMPAEAAAWLGLLDLAVNPHLFRKHLKQQRVEETTIRTFLRFLGGRKPHSESDRDKMDWLATYLFQAREERTKEPAGWPRNEVQEILEGFDFPPLSTDAINLLTDISSLLDEVKYFEKFIQIVDSRLAQRGLDLKKRFGEEFFHPAVLAAVINYNLVFGKKFHKLLQQALCKVHDLASHVNIANLDPRELLHSDYRLTSEAFRHLGEMDRTAGTEAAARGLDPFALESAAMIEQEMQDLGVDVDMETVNLKKRKAELSLRLRANPNVGSLPGGAADLPLLEWEANSFRTSYPDSERSFRVEFARDVSHAVAILSLIEDELHAYVEKRGNGFQWKKHSDTLIYLLREGRWHKERLLQLGAATEKKGLAEKAKQLFQTAERLDGGLSRVAAVF